jgi:hypothetical protein
MARFKYRQWGQIFIIDIGDRRRAFMGLLSKQTESKVKNKDLTPMTTPMTPTGSLGLLIIQYFGVQ